MQRECLLKQICKKYNIVDLKEFTRFYLNNNNCDGSGQVQSLDCVVKAYMEKVEKDGHI